jgi:hypothetical protein
MGHYVGYLDRRLFLFWASRLQGARHLGNSLNSFVLSRTFRSWSGVFTPA